MLNRLQLKNIALIEKLEVEFGEGLNLLTGETGSGKSIIVDSLGALTGDRVYSDLIKEGEEAGHIEGLFTIPSTPEIIKSLGESGIEFDRTPEIDIIVRRDLSLSGKNRIFVNDQMVTHAFLKRLGAHLVDIHGQGEHGTLYDVETHIEMLDEFASVSEELSRTFEASQAWTAVRGELEALEKDSAEKLQLLDILRFQVDEIRAANLRPDEETELEEEKLRLGNIEKLTSLSRDAIALLYDNEGSTAATLEKAQRKVVELSDYASQFKEYSEGIESARAVIEDLAFAVRDFQTHLEFSPERVDEIETRLAEITRLKRKYGGSAEAALEHLRVSEERLQNIETAEFRGEELKKELAKRRAEYLEAAGLLHDKRAFAAREFEKVVVENLKAVALEKARFEVRIEKSDTDDRQISAKGYDRVEFYFSANPGESPKPLARIASGGEASRLMLVLKTAARSANGERAAVFDEIDSGIGGRVAEAVGRRLKELSVRQQVMCVTHQPQIASLADRHFLVEKSMAASKTTVSIRELDAAERVEEIARMLAGEHITEAARQNARAMLAAAK